MLKLKTIFIVLLMSLIQVIRGQEISTNILECDDFFKEVYEKGKSQLFDLRVAEEYNTARLVDAILVDTKQKFELYLEAINKTDTIFVYCEKGKRSKECSQWLNDLGYINIFQLKGGFSNWRKSGFPIDSEKKNYK